MRRCKICKVPLEGFGLKISHALFRVSQSEEDPNLCNKCEAKSTTYKCEICQRFIDKKKALTHVKAEEYILSLIKKDHPEWNKKEDISEECLDY